MRKTGLLVCVSLLLVIGSFAGCFGKDDPPEDTPGSGDGAGTGNETGTGDDFGAGDGSGNETGTPDGGDGTGTGNETETPEEPAKPDPVNRTIEFEVGMGAGESAAGGTTLAVANGGWTSFTSTCTVTGTVGSGGWLSEGGHLGITFGEEELAGVDIDSTSQEAKTYELSVPSGEAGEYGFMASAGGTSGWSISCQVLINY